MRGILLWLLVFALFPLPSGLAGENTPIFTPGSHPRQADYPAAFAYQGFKGEAFALAYATQLNLTPEDEAELLSLFQEEITAITRHLPEEQLHKPTIYIVVQTIKGGSYAIENRVYTTLEDILSASHHPALLSAMMGTTEPWIIRGALSYITQETFDEEAILVFLNSQKDKGLLNLLGPRFYPSFNSPEELTATQYLAADLFTYTINSLGFDTLLAPIANSHWENWCRHLGFAYTPNPYMKDRFTYSWTKDFELVAQGEFANYHLSSEKFNITTALGVETWITRNQEGRQFLMDYIAQNASQEYATLMKENLNQTIDYFLYGQQSAMTSHADIRANKISLTSDSHHLHETVHFMIGVGQHEWLNEALCDYFAEILYPHSYTGDYILTALKEDNEPNSWAAAKGAYTKIYESNIKKDSFNLPLYMDALAYLSFTEPEKLQDLPSFTLSIGDKYTALYGEEILARLNDHEGLELSYGQGACFAGYLAKEYGLDTLLNYYYSPEPIEEFFGQSYHQLKEAWLQRLTAIFNEP